MVKIDLEDRDHVPITKRHCCVKATLKIEIMFLVLLNFENFFSNAACPLRQIVLGGIEFLLGGIKAEIVLKLVFLLGSFLLLLFRRLASMMSCQNGG